MNVYFVNHKYINSSYFLYLLRVLKVKKVYNFFEREQLPPEIQSDISPLLYNSFDGKHNHVSADKCAFWIKDCIEKNVRLISSVHGNSKPSQEELKRFSQTSAIQNLMNLNDDNCLILANLESDIDGYGYIRAPYCFIEEGGNLINHIIQYSLNILRKNYGHDEYANQVAFISFSEFFSESYRFKRNDGEWFSYCWPNKDYTKTLFFIQYVKHQLNKQFQEMFPIVIEDGKRKYTNLLSEEGKLMQKKLLERAEKIRIEEEKRQDEFDRQESLGIEEKRMNERDNVFYNNY